MSPDYAEYLSQVREPKQEVNPLFRSLNIQAQRISADETVLELPANSALLQGAGVLAGGIIATLLDEAMAHVALANIAPHEHVATVDLNVQYISIVKPGSALRATASVLKRGRRILFVEAVAESLPQGDPTENTPTKLAAKATASFIIQE